MATKYKPYEESEQVRNAYTALQNQQAQKPASYQSAWQSQLDDIMGKINNREKFSYDLNGDALYQQYKNQYMHNGKLAMMDTMGQASALTGGYGNSYAQQVGQQTYNGYLNQLNDKLPDLYNMAMSKYQMEGDDLNQRYNMMANRENQDYSRYQDAYNAYLTERNNLQSRYDAERNFDYGRYSDDLNMQYKQDRDAVSDAQWQAQFDENKRQFDLNYSKKSGGGGGSGSSSQNKEQNEYGEYLNDLINRGYITEDQAEIMWGKKFGLIQQATETNPDGVTIVSGGGSDKVTDNRKNKLMNHVRS